MGQYKKLVAFTQVIIFAIIAAFVVGALLHADMYKGIFLGVFIVVFYYSVTTLNEIYQESMDKKKEGFFDPRLFAILTISIFLLGAVTFITNIIFVYSVDYCKKGGTFYSEKRCALQSAENKIREKYGSPYNDYDYDY